MGPTDRLCVPAIGGIFFTLAFALAAVAQEGDRLADVRVLGNCKDCVFDGQDFSDRRLTGINFVTTQLSDISFDRTAMNIAIFDGADLRGVSFIDTDLSGASFVGTRLEDVTFNGADLRGAVFEGAIQVRTDMQMVRLCNTQLPDDIMDNSDCN
jgi:uncharacterized protein YjbI with pentapeptide repeats